MAANGISTLATKQERQIAKLNLASLKRQGYTLSITGEVISESNESEPFFRAQNSYEIVSGKVVWSIPLTGDLYTETGAGLLLEVGDRLFLEN